MKPADFFTRFKEGALLPFYYFYGEDEYLKTSALHLLLERLGEKIDRVLNFETFSVSSCPLANLVDHARTLPFLGGRKIVLLKEAEKIAPRDHEQLLTYVENPSRKTTLILTSSPLSFRGEAFNAFRKQVAKYTPYGLVLEVNHPYPNEVPDWVRYQAKMLEKKMGTPAIFLLQELIGNNLQELFNALEKLALFIDERKEITEQDIAAVISGLRMESVFQLIDDIGNRKLVASLTALAQLLKSGEQPLKVLALIARQFRMITQGRSLLNQGVEPEKIINQLKIKKFLWGKLSPQVNKFSEKKLADCFQHLWKADVALKTTAISQKLILEQLVIDLCV